MDNIIITGSRGFIGTAIRDHITFPYDEIDLALGTSHNDLKGHSGTLIHLSAWTNENESFANPVKYIDNNIKDLASILVKNNFDKVIFPSSTAVYNQYGDLEPDSIYGITKLTGEKLIKTYCKNYWILRIANPYSSKGGNSVLSVLMDCKANDKIFPIYDNNGLMKDFFPVKYIAYVVEHILTGIFEPGIYNVGTGNGTVVSDLLKSLCLKVGIRHEIVRAPQGLSAGYIPKQNLLTVNLSKTVEEEWQSYLS